MSFFKTILLFTILISSNYSFSSDFAINLNSNTFIATESYPCKTLVDLSRALHQYNLLQKIPLNAIVYNTPLIEQKNSLLKIENQICSLNLTKALPNSMNFLMISNPKISGINCWNTTLRISNLLHYSSYSNPRELSTWLQSDSCRPLRVGEKTLPGDLMIIRNKYFEEIHAFTYLTSTLSFNKLNYNLKSKFKISYTSDILKYYYVTIDKFKDLRVDKSGKLIQEPFTNFLQPYRCRKNTKQDFVLTQTEQDLIQKISTYSKDINDYIFYGEKLPFTRGELEQLIDQIEQKLTNIDNDNQYFFGRRNIID